jgi:DNA-binding MarR family transcriptional regulator
VKSPCYCAAVRVVARKTTALYDAALAPCGVNLAQYSLMRRIERAGAPSLTELASLAELDRSTVGRNVRVLQKLALVRIASAEDQREAAVTLTPVGVETLRRATPFWNEAQRKIETTLGAERAQTLLELARAL